tara:strand:+ start:1168 stop:1566 length:399 start_codon:yes stop_codon:yes gene_type:complete
MATSGTVPQLDLYGLENQLDDMKIKDELKYWTIILFFKDNIIGASSGLNGEKDNFKIMGKFTSKEQMESAKIRINKVILITKQETGIDGIKMLVKYLTPDDIINFIKFSNKSSDKKDEKQIYLEFKNNKIMI